VASSILAGETVGSVETLIFDVFVFALILIPCGRRMPDGMGLSNAGVTGRFPVHREPAKHPRENPPRAGISAAALFAPACALTILPMRHWNQLRVSGILATRGTVSGGSQDSEAKVKMRTFLIAVTGLVLFAAGAAQAKVSITIDKDAQMMTVAVDGVERYHWPVSTGIPSHETPNGSFRTFRMEEDHYSKEFDDAPMPHSIFFTKIGHAIHGTDSESRLGTPASHGCVRLSRAHALTLYALVGQEGVLNTTVTLTGSSQVALARNPRIRPATAMARRDPTQPYASQYDDVGDPVALAPQPTAPRQLVPQVRADDGYIYPADGSPSDTRYPSPRGSRRVYDGQVYYQQQPAYDNRNYYDSQPQVYAPRQRGLFGYQN
jgi:hypothetical protein